MKLLSGSVIHHEPQANEASLSVITAKNKSISKSVLVKHSSEKFSKQQNSSGKMFVEKTALLIVKFLGKVKGNC